MRVSSSVSSHRVARRPGRPGARSALLAVLLASGSHSLGQAEPTPELAPAVRYSLELISGKDIVEYARILSDPKLRGREASTPGAREAAACVINEFRKAGLRPGGSAGAYDQVFKIRLGYQVSAELTAYLGGASLGDFRRGTDYALVHLPGGKAEVDASCVLAGYGITAPGLKFDEYAGLDAKGKAVVVFTGVPWQAGTGRWLARSLGDQKYDTIAYKARNAAARGAACLLVVDDPAGWPEGVGVAEQLRVPDTASSLSSPIPVIHVARQTLTRLTEMSSEELHLLAHDIGREMAPESMALRGRRLRMKASITGRAQIGRNIVGILPGRDDALRREAVVLGAHYDHLGEGAFEEIYFGANDNAAGVGALLSIARAMAALPQRPKRTIVFVAFDAEEIGRRGSKHYVAKPAIPIAQTALMINFDMIGKNEPDAIYAVGTRSSDEVHEVHQRVNRHVGLRLLHPSSFRLGRSDHSPFYYAGVPIMYLFGGLDADYNTPQDTWDKLIPGKVEKVARLAFLTALEVAERESRPRFKQAATNGTIYPAPGAQR
ncbi:MAG: M20/M25/M40 family metallo-hydrolase [Phycisphaerae bacterium]